MPPWVQNARPIKSSAPALAGVGASERGEDLQYTLTATDHTGVLAPLIALSSSHNSESVTGETQIWSEAVWRGEVLCQRTCKNSGKFATRTLLSQTQFQRQDRVQGHS